MPEYSTPHLIAAAIVWIAALAALALHVRGGDDDDHSLWR